MNIAFKYIYIILIAVIVIELIYLITRLFALKKELDKLGIELESIENNLNEVKEHMETIGKTKDSWKFFLSLYLILSILKMTKKEYRKSKNPDKTYLKTLAMVCAKNISTINKIKSI